jgi:hypothetical protein
MTINMANDGPKLRLRELAIDNFNIKQAHDIFETSEGMLAWKAPWIAEFCYLVRLNRPLAREEIYQIQRRVSGKFYHGISLILSNFNGLSFLNSVFSIYGLRPKLLERGDFFTIQNVPFDLFSLNDFRKPKFAPSDLFLFATLGGAQDDYIDGFDGEGNIVTGKFSHSSDILQRWDDCETWFTDRCELAYDFYQQYYPSSPLPIRNITH